MNKNHHKTLLNNRTEEVADIIEKMPTKFGYYISFIIIGLVSLLILFGFIIKYPDVLTGQITITTRQAPIKLISSTSGTLILLKNQNHKIIKKGEYIGIIKNSANLEDIKKVENLLNDIKINELFYEKHRYFFPENANLGELNLKYFTFLNSLYQYLDYYKSKPYDKQKEINKKLLFTQEKIFKELNRDNHLVKIKYKNNQNLFNRDSLLFISGVISKMELEHSINSKISSQQEFNSIDKQIINNNYQIDEVKNTIQTIDIQKLEKERELIVNLATSYFDLQDNLKQWNLKYAFISPINGKIDFLNFLKNEDFIQTGQELFKIIPQNNELIGQVFLPEQGAGKTQIGQKVIIKLDNFPYTQFGSIWGKVKNISLVTNQQNLSTNQIKINSYLVLVSLPNGLKTNYDSKLTFHSESKGTAEIVTDDRKLIERFFSNLKYRIKN